MFTLVFQCMWVLKGRKDVSDRVYRLERGQWHLKRVGFGVSQAPGSPRFQMNDGVLQREMRWQHVFMAFSHCLWVLKGRTDVSDRCSVPGIRTSVP